MVTVIIPLGSLRGKETMTRHVQKTVHDRVRVRPLYLPVIALMATSIYSGTACAQQAADVGGAETEAANAKPNEIIVTAQKRSERLQDVPISISVLGGEALEKQGTDSAADMLSRVAGVNVGGQGVTTTISVRGVAAGGAWFQGSGTVGYYVDSAPFGFIRGALVPDTSVYDLSRIEVLRGPQGTLYGASALNGVIRIITNDPDPARFDLKAKATGYTIDQGGEGYRGDLAVNIPLVADQLALRFAVSGERVGGWVDEINTGVKDANTGDKTNVRVKLGYKPDDRLSIVLSTWLSHNKSDGGSTVNRNGVRENYIPEPTTINFNEYNAQIKYEWDHVFLTSSSTYLGYKSRLIGDFHPATTAPSYFISIQNSAVYSEELVLNSKDTKSYRWSVGAYYRSDKDHVYQDIPNYLIGPLDWDDKSNSYAVFGEFTKIFDDGRLELTGGLRYFHDKVKLIELQPSSGNPNAPLQTKESTFTAVSPRAVLTWLPSRHFTAYASFSKGFRSGFAQNPLVLATAPGLPDVGPDKLFNYEIGAKGDLLDGGLSFDGAVYYMDWKDIQQNIQYYLASLNGYFGAVVNVAAANGVGVDFSVTAHPAQGFNIGGGLSWNNLKLAEDVFSGGVKINPKGNRPVQSPAFTANAFADYSMTLNDALDGKLSISASHQSRLLSATQNTGILYSNQPFSLRASAEITSKDGWTLRLFGENLTNWHGSTTTFNPSLANPNFSRPRPRTIGLAFEYHI
jgi:outer membrane receptor protein involved in Fe transport